MMLSPVSSVRFTANPEVEAILNRPQKYSKSEAQISVSAPKKKGSVAKKIGWTVAVLGAAAIALAGLRHYNVIKLLDTQALADAGIFKKATHYAAVAGQKILDFARPLANKVRGWLPSSK